MTQKSNYLALLVCICMLFLTAYAGDHMSLQGGMMKRNNIRPFYLELLERIETLAET